MILASQLFPVFYAVVGVPGSQKGYNFTVMDRVLIGLFDITAVSQYLWRRWAEESEQWTGNRRFIFRPLSSRASHPCSMPRSPSLAHKAPVMQAKRGRTSATQ